MGRRKISIAPIADDRNRSVTFLKRKNGLFKKAYELGILCSAEVAVVVFTSAGKLFEFSSGDIDSTLLRYSNYSGAPHERRGPADYTSKDVSEIAKRGLGGKMTALSDIEDDDDEEDLQAGRDDEEEAASPPKDEAAKGKKGSKRPSASVVNGGKPVMYDSPGSQTPDASLSQPSTSTSVGLPPPSSYALNPPPTFFPSQSHPGTAYNPYAPGPSASVPPPQWPFTRPSWPQNPTGHPQPPPHVGWFNQTPGPPPEFTALHALYLQGVNPNLAVQFGGGGAPGTPGGYNQLMGGGGGGGMHGVNGGPGQGLSMHPLLQQQMLQQAAQFQFPHPMEYSHGPPQYQHQQPPHTPSAVSTPGSSSGRSVPKPRLSVNIPGSSSTSSTPDPTDPSQQPSQQQFQEEPADAGVGGGDPSSRADGNGGGSVPNSARFAADLLPSPADFLAHVSYPSGGYSLNSAVEGVSVGSGFVWPKVNAAKRKVEDQDGAGKAGDGTGDEDNKKPKVG